MIHGYILLVLWPKIGFRKNGRPLGYGRGSLTEVLININASQAGNSHSMIGCANLVHVSNFFCFVLTVTFCHWTRIMTVLWQESDSSIGLTVISWKSWKQLSGVIFCMWSLCLWKMGTWWSSRCMFSHCKSVGSNGVMSKLHYHWMSRGKKNPDGLSLCCSTVRWTEFPVRRLWCWFYFSCK